MISAVLICEEEEEGGKTAFLSATIFQPNFSGQSQSVTFSRGTLPLPGFCWALLGHSKCKSQSDIQMMSSGESEYQCGQRRRNSEITNSHFSFSWQQIKNLKIKNFLFHLASQVNWILVFLKIFVQEEAIWATAHGSVISYMGCDFPSNND